MITPITPYIKARTSEVELSKHDAEIFSTIKTKQEWTCMICDNKINSGSMVLGAGYVKVCLSCADKFLENIEYSFKSRAEEIKKVKDYLIENKEQFEKINMVAKIKAGS